MADFHIVAGGSLAPARPRIRTIGPADLRAALARGFDDFKAMPSHLIFLSVIYVVMGVMLSALTFSGNALPLLFPLVSGFALVGPFAAIGLYEISRRRELGLEIGWRNAFDVLRSPSIPAIAALGLILMGLLIAWLMAAEALYESLYGPLAPESLSGFLAQVLTTERGWQLFILGNLVGFAFAVVVLSISVVSFPLLLDRDVGLAVAIETSVRAVLANPSTLAVWGLIVAAALVLGSLPLFVGLSVVMPILGHATWHLYRRLVVPEPTRGNAPRQP
jgi:uncharacterized membrane protein